MKNTYYNQIIELLSNRPDGMKPCKIARHIYNSHCGLFEEKNLYPQIYSSVRRFLWEQSHKNESPFSHKNNEWGVYTLKKSFVTQLELVFDNWEYDIVQESKKKAKQKEEPNLFGW